MNEELRKLLGDLADQVIAKLGTVKVIIDDGKMIPKHRFDEVIEEKEIQRKANEKATKDLEALKVAAVGNEALQKQISDLQSARQKEQSDFVAKEASLKKSFAVQTALLNAGVLKVKARNLLAREFDVDALQFDANGKLVGLEEKINEMKVDAELSPLFGTVKVAGKTPGEGDSPDASLGEWATKNPWSKKTLSIADQVQLTKSNPQLATKLQAAASSV